MTMKIDAKFIETIIYVHSSKDDMWETGEKLGLSGEALQVFKHTACEVALKIRVNTETGYSEIIELTNRSDGR